MSNLDVVHAWVAGEQATADNLSTDGTVLTSYNTAIGNKIGIVALLTTEKHSPTTSSHISLAMSCLHEGYRVIEYFKVPHIFPENILLHQLNYEQLLNNKIFNVVNRVIEANAYNNAFNLGNKEVNIHTLGYGIVHSIFEEDTIWKIL